MADLQNKMSAHQQDIDHAKEQIHETTQKADSYLTDLTKRVEEYEKKHSDFEPAGQYLKSALDASRSATQSLKTRGQDLSERSVPTALDGMQQVRQSLDELQKQAVAYDDKYAGSRGQQAMDTLHSMVNSGRQRATDALETANDQLMKLRDAIGNMAGQATHGAQVAVGEAVRAAEYGDEKLGVSTKAGGVVQRLHDLDARLGVTATAAKVDSKVTGGLGSKVAATTVDIVTESVSYISETLQNAKLAAQHSETAQSVEAKGAAVAGAAVTKKNEVQETFNQGYEKGREVAGMATKKTEETAGATKEKAGEMTDKTKEKAGEATEMAKDKAGMAKEKAGDVKDMTREKAGEATEMAKDKAGMAKEKAGDVKDMTQEKAGEATEMAKDKAGMVKDKAGDVKDTAKEKTGQATEMAKDKAGQAKESAKDTAGTAKEKASEATDMANEKGGQAKESAKNTAGMAKEKTGKTTEMTKDKAGQAKDKASETAGQAKDKAGDMKETTKEQAGQTKEQSGEKEGVIGSVVGKAKETLGSAVDTAKSMGTRTEAKATKPKEPTTTQSQTSSEKALEALKQNRAKDSEAAKTAAGTARKEMHGKQTKVDETAGEAGATPGFQQAQQHAAKSSK